MTPTSVTSGRSRPLAIICVPTSTSAWWLLNCCRISSCAPLKRVASWSQRRVRASGKQLAHGLLHLLGARAEILDALAAAVGAALGLGAAEVAVMADQHAAAARRPWCGRSAACRSGRTSSASPQSRQKTNVDVPRRLRNRMACSRRARVSRQRRLQAAAEDGVLPARSSWRRSTTSTGGRSIICASVRRAGHRRGSATATWKRSACSCRRRAWPMMRCGSSSRR